MGGCNFGHSPASVDVSVETQPIQLDETTVAAINRQLLLIHTGKVRLARNLLQNVIRNWYARDTSTVECFHQLVENARQCASAMQKG